jgi:hypothetical protein
MFVDLFLASFCSFFTNIFLVLHLQAIPSYFTQKLTSLDRCVIVNIWDAAYKGNSNAEQEDKKFRVLELQGRSKDREVSVAVI